MPSCPVHQQALYRQVSQWSYSVASGRRKEWPVFLNLGKRPCGHLQLCWA